MIFNSIAFFVFLAIFLPLYFVLKGRMRLVLCLVASYFFYGWWDWRFLSLILTSTLIDYAVGLQISKTEDPRRRKRLLTVSMIANLGFLAFFKYFNFFIESFRELMLSVGVEPSFNTLYIILPVGISFYTFQSMSYTIDVYFKKIEIEKDFLRFSTFISFFPQLVAGPIVRASDFLPQFKNDREFSWDRVIAGSGQMLWGFYKKVVVADSLAPFVDQCFAAPGGFSSLHLLIGVIFYSFQIYCDFSGYSDIAIGLARIMGFDFPDNFRTPYFSRNFSEFWTRWHISLSSWLRDYLYIPLGGSRSGSLGSRLFTIISLVGSVAITGWWWLIPIYIVVIVATARWMRGSKKASIEVYTYLNLMITMLLGGLWHGASWAFVFWGFLHGLYLVVQRLLGPWWGKLLDALRAPQWLQAGLDMALVYFFTCLAWVYFRAPDFEIANQVIEGIASLENFTPGSIVNKFWVFKGFIVIAILVAVDWTNLQVTYYKVLLRNPIFRVLSFSAILWLIAFFGTFGSNSFIYFQF